jgi:hypothetical protein
MHGPRTEAMPVSESGNEMKVYQLAREDVEKMLADKFGKKLTAVNRWPKKTSGRQTGRSGQDRNA